MADLIDLAQDAAERFLAMSLRNAQHRDTISPKATGECLSCGNAVALERRWCDADCRDDWERNAR